MKYKTTISKSINEIDANLWDSVAEHSFTKHETLKIVEQLELCKNSYYLQVFDDDKLVAIAVLYGQTKTLYDSLEKTIYGKYYTIVKPVLGLNPALLCYFPYSPFSEMFKISEKYEKDKLDIFQIITNEIKSLAIDANYKSYGFLGIGDSNLIKQKDLFAVFSGFKIKIFILKDNFEEQINACFKSCRHTIRKERNLFIKSNYTIERVKKLNKTQKKLFKVFDDNLEKYGGNDEELKLYKDFIIALDKNCDKVTYFLVKLNNKITCALMVIEDEKSIIGLRAGQAKADNGGFSFFNVSVYEPIIYAIENSKKYVDLGTGNYKYKTRRGAKLFDCYSLISSTSKFKNLYLKSVLNILSKRNRKKHNSRLDKKIEKEENSNNNLDN